MNQNEIESSVSTLRVETPNDPKLSDCGARRGGCAVGLRGAAAVTRGAVRCSALLAVSFAFMALQVISSRCQ